MGSARNRRRLAMAGLLAVSMFSRSYSDKDKKEDDKAKRAELAQPWDRRDGAGYG